VLVGAAVCGTAGGIFGNHRANKAGATGWNKVGYIAGWAAGGAAVGGLIGWGVGAAATAIGTAATAGSSGTLGTVIYNTWQQAEQSLRNGLDAVSKTFRTTAELGNRVVDAFNTQTGVIAEAKYGYACRTEFILNQIAKDAWLLANNASVKAIEWHFYISQLTGKGGPSDPLLQELFRAGIKVIFH